LHPKLKGTEKRETREEKTCLRKNKEKKETNQKQPNKTKGTTNDPS
jgi:hypothetical protein